MFTRMLDFAKSFVSIGFAPSPWNEKLRALFPEHDSILKKKQQIAELIMEVEAQEETWKNKAQEVIDSMRDEGPDSLKAVIQSLSYEQKLIVNFETAELYVATYEVCKSCGIIHPNPVVDAQEEKPDKILN